MKDILVFFTGADQEPPLGFPNKPVLTFLHKEQDVLPTASTCALELRIPTSHKHYDTFKTMMVTGLAGHGGFGLI